MGSDNKPCCAAEALRRIRQIPINGIPTGICMLDECIAEVKTQDFAERTGDPGSTPQTNKGVQLHSHEVSRRSMPVRCLRNSGNWTG